MGFLDYSFPMSTTLDEAGLPNSNLNSYEFVWTIEEVLFCD